MTSWPCVNHENPNAPHGIAAKAWTPQEEASLRCMERNRLQSKLRGSVRVLL